MKATDVIKRDHEAAKEMYEKLKAGTEEERKVMEEKIFAALDTHEKMEDTYFYPALENSLKEDEAFITLEGEQTMLKAEVAAIKLLPLARDEALIKAMEKVLEHAQKEEMEIFPKAEEFLGTDRLEEIGQQMEPMSAVANA